jgi:ubiquinone/menaquinone biosynthesis C-methylase UbiE
MKENNQQQYLFNTWVPEKMVSIPAILGVCFLAVGILHWVFWIIAILFFLISSYFFIAKWMFSPDGKDVQNKILDMLVVAIHWDGEGTVLDIGCGSGQLIIKLAQRCPNAHFCGTDYWGKNWDYSRAVCKSNAEIAGISDRVTFKNGSAVALPFDENQFDLVVSNLTFHEVMNVKDKSICLKEALRVLKPGGIFVFQDLFLLTPYFGTSDELLQKMKQFGAEKVKFTPTHGAPFIPGWIKLPFMVGTIAILHGIKE